MKKIFLKLFITGFALWSYASCADDFKEDFAVPFSASVFFSTPASTPISDLLADASSAIGHACTLKKLENLRNIGNEIIMQFVALMNRDFEHADLAVSRLVHFWLLNKDIRGNAWLEYIKGDHGEELSKAQVLIYLVGDDGIITRTLGALAQGKKPIPKGMSSLVEVFKNAAKNFGKLADNHLEFVVAQRDISTEYGCFSGSPSPYAENFDILDAALIVAMRNEPRLSIESRLAKLEEEVDSLKARMENSIFQWPVTIWVSIVIRPVQVVWPWIPFHGTIENMSITKSLWCSALCTASAIPLLGKALEENGINQSIAWVD